jgi:ribosomal protection tetracycline resistance protein
VARKTLNLGILAHVDAGKTTLTERLLYAAGVIDEVGSVDDGTTQTDSLALEQQRGITIKSAVVSFAIDDVTVNLVDTPGHPDFIAEVERVLSVLDGAVLVISAVEGVQSQTPLLMRALRKLGVPTLIFVNKIDRPGASEERVLEAIAKRLTPAAIPVGSPYRAGLVEALAERDDRILTAYVDGDEVPYARLRGALADQAKRGLVHPVYFGSALQGTGIEPLMSGIGELLPAADGDVDGPVSGSVFKIERGQAGEKIAYVRMFSGTVRTRDRVRFGADLEAKVTAVEQRGAVSAGEIGKLWGLSEIQIGDAIGEPRTDGAARQFGPPTLEAVVFPNDPADRHRLRVALGQVAEQEPLIGVRQDDELQELSVSLYGEIQQQVIQATLASDFGLDVTFRETTPICVERPTHAGEAVEVLHAESNPYRATIGLRVEPAPPGSGIDFRLDVDTRTVPLYVYKTLESFESHMNEYVRRSLDEGIFGWQVTDCTVTMIECVYSVPDGPPSRRGELSTAADFRKLTPIVVMRALERAGVAVCEPMSRVSIELPTRTVGAVLPLLARLGAIVDTPSVDQELSRIGAVVPAARLHELQRELSAVTGGEGMLESEFAGYQAVGGEPPSRRRVG